jgi:hypothetical protein
MSIELGVEAPRVGREKQAADDMVIEVSLPGMRCCGVLLLFLTSSAAVVFAVLNGQARSCLLPAPDLCWVSSIRWGLESGEFAMYPDGESPVYLNMLPDHMCHNHWLSHFAKPTDETPDEVSRQRRSRQMSGTLQGSPASGYCAISGESSTMSLKPGEWCKCPSWWGGWDGWYGTGGCQYKGVAGNTQATCYSGSASLIPLDGGSWKGWECMPAPPPPPPPPPSPPSPPPSPCRCLGCVYGWDCTKGAWNYGACDDTCSAKPPVWYEQGATCCRSSTNFDCNCETGTGT